MAEFNAEKKEEGSKLIFQFSGHIDEDAQFSGLDFGSANEIKIDLEKVSAINSCGIREWIKWIRTAPSSSKIVYSNCPKVIVDQINMVAGFLPDNAKVESFYVPYYSEDSGNEKMVLFREGNEFSGGDVKAPEEIKDEETGDTMEMDVIEAKYFKFLKK